MHLEKPNRPLRDLRSSVADRCNFRCVYFMTKEVSAAIPNSMSTMRQRCFRCRARVAAARTASVAFSEESVPRVMGLGSGFFMASEDRRF